MTPLVATAVRKSINRSNIAHGRSADKRQLIDAALRYPRMR
jgi:hypothetical protein